MKMNREAFLDIMKSLLREFATNHQNQSGLTEMETATFEYWVDQLTNRREENR